MNSSADRSLLFGILAWQNGFIATEPLLTAIRVWIDDKSRPLGEVLVQQGGLTAQQRALLEQLIDARVLQDGGDAGQSLANLSTSLPFADKLAAMHDDALAASLSKLPPAAHRVWPGDDSESHSSRASGQSHASATSDDWLNPVLDRFEAAWREHVNAAKKSEPTEDAQLPAPRLEDFLNEVPDKQQKIALRELLIIELHWRRKNGETPEHKSYQRRFPDWSHVVDDAFNLANGRYQVNESFAKGGLGEVFIARDLELNRPVAFKCVRADRDREESRKRLVIEGEITGGLEHPGIVPVYGLGHFQDGRPFYAMRFIKGENLRRALRKFHGLPLEDEDPKLAETELLPESTRSSPASRSDQPVASASLFDRKRLEFRELLGRFVDVCQALAYAHDRKVLHRDLKPGNIMLGKYGETLVVDWGLAKTLGRKEELTPFDPRLAFDGPVIPTSGSDLHLTRGNVPAGQLPLIGTLGYISPEQAAGKLEELGAGTDIFSLGATLFELLTGQPPIGAVLPGAAGKRLTQKDVEAAARKGEFLRPRLLLPEVPAPLEAVCLKAMSFHPQDRYPTAKALAEEIERWLADEPVSAWPEPFAVRASRWMKRHQIIVATTTAAVVVAMIGFGGLASVTAQHNKDLAHKQGELIEETKRANRKADEARLNLYDMHMNFAQRNWEIPQVGLVLDSLEKTRPRPSETDFRGFEWHYWNRLCHSSLLDLKGHTDEVSSVAFSADGKRLASASWDKTIKVWDATSGQETRTLNGHTSGVRTVAFSADGKRLASGGDDGAVRVWDVASGQVTLTLKRDSVKKEFIDVFSVAFSPDGTRLASAHNGAKVTVWDAVSGEEKFTLNVLSDSVAFSPDGKRLASAVGSYNAPGEVKVWDAQSGQEILTLKGHNNRVTSVAFSADGKRLASASDDRTVKVWDMTSGLETHTLKGHNREVWCVVFSPDCKRLASASLDQTVMVWDAATGWETLTLRGHTGWVRSVAFSPDGRRLATGSADTTVKVWDATSGQETFSLKEHSGQVDAVAFHPNQKWLASAGGYRDKTVTVWDATSGQEMLKLNGHRTRITSLTYSSDGSRLASASEDETVKLWDVTSGQEIHTLIGHNGMIRSIAFSTDGKRLASASDDKTIKIWDARNGQELLTLKGHTRAVHSVTFSADGKRLASGDGDIFFTGEVKVWDATSGQETLALKRQTQRAGITSVTFSPDGKRLASGCADTTASVWDVRTGQEMLTLKGHTSSVSSVVFSPDGARLASASYDGTVKVWDATSGQETLTLKGHYGAVASVAFSADAQRLASASSDRTVKVWDARPWTPELRAEREALSLIHFLRDQGKPKAEWLDAIAVDQTLSEPVRQRALQFAREWK